MYRMWTSNLILTVDVLYVQVQYAHKLSRFVVVDFRLSFTKSRKIKIIIDDFKCTVTTVTIKINRQT